MKTANPLARRIIPCLDVKGGQVVKGVQFRGHEVVGGVLELARRYAGEGADELVFYDITASPQGRTAPAEWVSQVAREIDIPFCVAGGINSVGAARELLERGADKISVNSPALRRPELISELVAEFGGQCVVLGVDSFWDGERYLVYTDTGDEHTAKATGRETAEWIAQAIALGAGEVVLNCMNRDGVRAGYDLEQLRAMRRLCSVPLVISGGAGAAQHFAEAFAAGADGALAASVFHRRVLGVPELRAYLSRLGIPMRSPYLPQERI